MFNNEGIKVLMLMLNYWISVLSVKTKLYLCPGKCWEEYFQKSRFIQVA